MNSPRPHANPTHQEDPMTDIPDYILGGDILRALAAVDLPETGADQ